jgi:hypothetical protein
LDDEPLYRCPLRPTLDEPEFYASLFSCWTWFKRGNFPDPGTWLDQTARFVELMNLVEKAVTDAEEKGRKAPARPTESPPMHAATGVDGQWHRIQ